MRLFAVFMLLTVIYSVGPGEALLLEPTPMVVKEGYTVDVGDVGPGQTFSIMISTRVDEGGRYGNGGNWDRLETYDLPSGWVSTFSEYGPQLKIHIRVSPDALPGDYIVHVRVIDEGDIDGIGPVLAFNVKVHVTTDVVDVHVEPSEQVVGAGQPARYFITIHNKGYASDRFKVEARGVSGWRYYRDVFVPRRETYVVSYEIVNDEEEVLSPEIVVTSYSSPRIQRKLKVGLVIHSDPTQDARALRNGMLLFPFPEVLIYDSIRLFSSLLG
ncbi:MAG: COG1470 family protein [Candidatus Asgardarchaeia archaeon]